MKLKGKFCDRPFRMFEVAFPNEKNEIPCFTCCANWLPVKIGDLSKDSISEIWNSEEIKNIRKSILLGDFKYCDHTRCPEILTDSLHNIGTIDDPYLVDIIKNNKVELDCNPHFLNLAYDQTCNLACPSCRTDFIITNKGKKREVIELTSRKILDLNFEDVKNIMICSSGDPFASEHFRDFLFKFDGKKYTDTKIQIITNGVLFTPAMWDKLSHIHNNIGDINISLDAVHEETYNIVRKGGNLKQAIENVRFLVKLHNDKGYFTKIKLDFVVQTLNYKEMELFVLLGKELGVTEVYFQKIINWGTYSETDFKYHEVYHPDHRNYDDFISVINKDIFNDPIVNMGNLSFYRSNSASRKNHSFSFKNAILHTFTKKFRMIKTYFHFKD